MTDPFPDFDELRDLLDALCEETISAEQMQRLEQLVLAHPAAEAYYVQYVSMYADLAGHFAGLPGVTEASLRGRLTGEQPKRDKETRRRGSGRLGGFRVSPSRRLLVWGGLAGLAAGLLVALTLMWPRQRPEVRPSPESAGESFDSSVAVLLRAPGAEWEKTDLPTRPGTPLSPGWLRLKSGLAQIEFYSGATVILQGPAAFQLISSNEAYCAAGRLRATVPPQAQGFTIGTPKLELVDRGTEFGVQVDAGDKTEVHVFQGKVELYDAGSDRQASAHKELTTGQSVRLDGPGEIRSIQSDPDAFHTAQYLEARAVEETRRQRDAWRASSEALRRDPSLVVYYTFQTEQRGSRTLLDQAGGRQQPHDGVIVGCRWGAGRWPGKKGLEFKRVSDRVRLRVPGKFDALTLMAWVRVDALPNQNNSLFMVDGWPEGAPHWQIGETGTLILGVRAPRNTPNAHYHAPGVLTPERLGQWVHMAVVYDRGGGLITQYVDGRAVVQEPVLFDTPLRLGNAEIGNWNVRSGDSRQPIRNFSGCMDEFMLFSRALGEQEIERLYVQGRPPL